MRGTAPNNRINATVRPVTPLDRPPRALCVALYGYRNDEPAMPPLEAATRRCITERCAGGTQSRLCSRRATLKGRIGAFVPDPARSRVGFPHCSSASFARHRPVRFAAKVSQQGGSCRGSSLLHGHSV